MHDSENTYVIEFQEVNKWFGDLHVLKNVSIRIEEAEVVVVCGPSGSGKSTLIRCVNQLERIDSGAIKVFGQSVDKSSQNFVKLRSVTGMVFQMFNLYPHKTVLQNITLAPQKVKGVPKKEAEILAMELLERVDLPEKANDYPAYLSGGQQQRVAIARALAMKPRIMMFDEPTSALDPEMINEVLQVMADLAKEGMTMIIVTHEMGFARTVSDRMVFMDEGEIIETASTKEFFSRPNSERTKLFLSKILSHEIAT